MVTAKSYRRWATVTNAFADYDHDGDLALVGSRADGMHLVIRNITPAADAARGLHVRVYAAATTRLNGARLVDSGSGYDAQNDMPVHVGVPAGVSRVAVQVIAPRGGRHIPGWQCGVAPGKTITVRAR